MSPDGDPTADRTPTWDLAARDPVCGRVTSAGRLAHSREHGTPRRPALRVSWRVMEGAPVEPAARVGAKPSAGAAIAQSRHLSLIALAGAWAILIVCLYFRR